MKKSLIALLLLIGLGGAGYWLQQNGQLQMAWNQLSEFKASLESKPAEASAPRKPAAGGNRGPLPVEVAAARPAQLSDDINAIGTLLPGRIGRHRRGNRRAGRGDPVQGRPDRRGRRHPVQIRR